jgi:integrase/recombinase XerD
MASLLSVWGGVRVSEIAALSVSDVVSTDGKIVKQIRLRADQTKGRMGRVVFLSEKLRREPASYIEAHPKNSPAMPLIYSQRGYGRFSNGTLCTLFGGI